MKQKSFFIAALLCCITLPAAATETNGLCNLITEMQSVFKIIRTFAFVGAGFILAKYAWEAISEKKLAGSDDMVTGVKKIGIPMIIGFILLFGIGTLLQILTSINGMELIGCSEQLFNGW